MNEFNQHISHLEENILDHGIDGLSMNISIFRDLYNKLINLDKNNRIYLSTKVDGSPAILCGVNPENGRFFVSTKSAFNKLPKLNYTNEDIDRNHPSVDLNKKLKFALKYLPELGIDNILQGDFMYDHDDVTIETIHGVNYVTFQPNTITYAVPLDTDLGRKIFNSQIGIIFHTSYYGVSLSNLKSSPVVNIGKLNHTKDVWFRDSEHLGYFHKENLPNFTEVFNRLKSNSKEMEQYSGVLNKFSVNSTINSLTKMYINDTIKKDTEINFADLVAYIGNRYDKEISDLKLDKSKARKEEQKLEVLQFFNKNIHTIKLILNIMENCVVLKEMLMFNLETNDSLNTFLHDSNGKFIRTTPEGFVLHYNHNGNRIVNKLVRRKVFSRHNFSHMKDWKKV